jgi:glycosyltransferase involved in cell wall biosynthesis
LTQAEVKYLLQHATAAVFPSLDESFGLPLAEAITERCPLAASDLPFAREVAGPAAVYFDPLDPDSIAACVSELVARPEVSGLAAQHAREQGVRFKPESVAGRIAGIIEDAALRGQPDTPKVERECVDALLAPYLLPGVAGAYEA